MEQFAWVLWVVIGVALIVGEVFTLGFVLFWFGLGALAAAFVAYLGFGFGTQFLVFAILSTILTVLSRTIFRNFYALGEGDHVRTGIDSLPGQIGTVATASRGALGAGAVKVFGSTWTAFPIDDEEPLVEGEKVEVVRVEGASIYVRRVEKLPEWREEEKKEK
jgi:membrane protein implicated in regulation of membrane protease activity